MKDNENVAEVINDLIKINNDRIEGYGKASDELKDSDVELHSLFNRFINESAEIKSDLSRTVSQYGGDEASGTTAIGKVYRAWMDVKAAFSGNNRKAVLESCEFGEDAAQKAYKMALDEDDLPADVRELFVQQKQLLKTSHDLVKSLRDSVPA